MTVKLKDDLNNLFKQGRAEIVYGGDNKAAKLYLFKKEDITPLADFTLKVEM